MFGDFLCLEGTEVQCHTQNISPVTKNSSQGNVFSPTSHQLLDEGIEEAVELKLKGRNAVLFGLPEGEKDDDLQTVRQLVSGNDCEVKASDIVYTFRDGPTLPNKPRFLKVVCTTAQAKRKFIDHINKVARRATTIPLRARPDLTFKQRETGRALRKKLSELDSPTHFINF